MPYHERAVPVTHPDGGAQSPMQFLLDVKQFLFFIQYRLEECQTPAAARAILTDVDVALSRLDEALSLLQSDTRRRAPAGRDGMPVAEASPRRSASVGR
jgi:hypothetical protein